MLLGGGSRLLKRQLQLPASNHLVLDDEIDTICNEIYLE